MPTKIEWGLSGRPNLRPGDTTAQCEERTYPRALV